MNRKNLTAAVLAGLAGAAGIVGSAQAVNINPDGLGQVLIYPYYTTNGGNQTLLSVVNTSEEAKAVKVRFMEGENSREVLDFNLYMSAYDVWTAAIYDDAGTPTLITTDKSCTVPTISVEAFLPYRLTDSKSLDKDASGNLRYDEFDASGNLNPGFFDDISRAAEGHFEMIEMGTLMDGDEAAVPNDDWVDPEGVPNFCEDGVAWSSGHPNDLCTAPNLAGDRNWTADELAEPEFLAAIAGHGSATAATHVGGVPANCGQLVDAWTEDLTLDASGNGVDGYWLEPDGNDTVALIDIGDPSGGLFGGAAIVNVNAGTMYSYDAKAIDGFSDSADAADVLHAQPGTILPSLNSGNEFDAHVFVDGNTTSGYDLDRGVDAVSFVFMHDQIMNEYTTEVIAGADTEWVITFPTKQFYVHQMFLDNYASAFRSATPAGKWAGFDSSGDLYGPNAVADSSGNVGVTDPSGNDVFIGVAPFTTTWTWTNTTWDTDASGNSVVVKEGAVNRPCEVVSLDKIWDREEQEEQFTTTPGTPRPPIVSPAPPQLPGVTPGVEFFDLCYETSVIAFGDDTGAVTSILGSSNFHRIDNTLLGFETCWARLNLQDATSDIDQDGDLDPLFRTALGDTMRVNNVWENGYLYGLPVTGFAVQRFARGDGLNALANYGGIFQHKGTRDVCLGIGSDCDASN